MPTHRHCRPSAPDASPKPLPAPNLRSPAERIAAWILIAGIVIQPAKLLLEILDII